MPGSVRVGGVWKEIAQPYVRVGGVWKEVAEAWTRVGGVWKKWFEPSGAMKLISTQLISSNTSSITFSSIPTTYKHLQIRWTARVNVGYVGDAYIRFNGDTGNNFRNHTLSGTDSTIFAGDSYLTSGIYLNGAVNGGASPASSFAAGYADILDYANTSKTTTLRALHGGIDNVIKRVTLSGGLWTSTAAVNSVTFFTYNSFVSGTRVSLYGIKG